ncbi:hypothetical protein K3X41_02775 [Aliiroseovarius crassostreae]|uniref:hypothetical protein n=1 Tax=Aliiroseovarius crassostreae TaxID=154981 RepID=UPI0021FFB08B|nr:hypothetical protein [Aliiroseovarius crassostreae]UWP92787.1 hypothetical protein K3X13_02725 [Aliiroseovarius crassostreae]UWP99101.1 hypothetical protein K3X53_02770 [Aliiroseovarius crassostreae]UWQ08535.1 hypothetical protein K3X25_02785 [Aliiroseovarius crassostreae]UWQ11637.1 hypothetical protein K3X41_02775 [Aliiroseovarius crassostreae]
MKKASYKLVLGFGILGLGFASSVAEADPNSVLKGFSNACLQGEISNAKSRPLISHAGMRVASMNEELFTLVNEDAKGTIYEVDPSMLNYRRPFVAGCNVVSVGRFAADLKAPLEALLLKRGYVAVKAKLKAGKISGAKTAILGAYKRGSRVYEIYVGDVKYSGRKGRTFLLVGQLP